MNPDDVSHGQRALWTFLGFTLVGPFFAGLATAAALLLAPPLGLGALLPDNLPPVGVAAASVFVWAAVPSALAAIGILPIVFKTGTFGALTAAVAGVVAFALATLVVPIPFQEGLPVFAFAAGLVAMLVRFAVLAGGIIRP